MNVVFLGSGDFAVPILDTLHRFSPQYPLRSVVTRPARPAGRGRKLVPTPVHRRCGELGIPCRVPETVNDPAFLENLRALPAELIIVADYGEILRRPFLDLAAIGAFNLHSSVLPRHRGASPVAHAILSGDRTSGVTLFRIEDRLDSGPVVATVDTPIGDDESAGELEARLSILAAGLLERCLPLFADGSFTETPQDSTAATLAPKLAKDTALIDWSRDVLSVHNRIRAFRPWPAAFTYLHRRGEESERTVILRAEPGDILDPAVEPGTVVRVGKKGIQVACRGGSLNILELQRPGKVAMSASAYLCGRALREGDRFGPPVPAAGKRGE